MNNILSTQSGAAELKDNYNQDPAYVALKRRRQKMIGKLQLEDQDLKEDPQINTQFNDELLDK